MNHYLIPQGIKFEKPDIDLLDGLLICNGKTLEEDIEGYLDKGLIQVAINLSINRLRFKEPVYYIYLDDIPAIHNSLATHPDKDKIEVVKWIPKMGKNSRKLSIRDYPELVNWGFAIFTAIHYLLCCGCKNIYAVGFDLEDYPAKDQLLDKFNDLVIPEFERLEVDFYSRAIIYISNYNESDFDFLLDKM